MVRLLGAAFVGGLRTGQRLLDIIKPAFLPSQDPQVKAEGFKAWVALAESLSRSGCAHKTSRQVWGSGVGSGVGALWLQERAPVGSQRPLLHQFSPIIV